MTVLVANLKDEMYTLEITDSILLGAVLEMIKKNNPNMPFDGSLDSLMGEDEVYKGERVREVYLASHQGEWVYVGHGGRGRWRHVRSGRSGCYELNKLHFQGEYVNVAVIPLSQEILSLTSSESLEECFIRHLKPKFNKRGAKSYEDLGDTLTDPQIFLKEKHDIGMFHGVRFVSSEKESPSSGN